jgi:hypothetical protein
MLGNLGQLAQVMKQAKELQSRLADVQKKLAQTRVEATAGGGMVTVTANGQQEILAVKIDRAVVKPDEVELLEELVLAAVNAARKKAEAAAREEMASLAGGLNLPPDFPLPGAAP